MRLLHTSDWHLGQTLHDFDRSYEHQCFLDWLLDTLAAEQTDVLLIAGDVFDNANPSAAAQRQLYRFLTQARQRVPGLAIVLVAGNHDSPGRLEAPAPFLELFDATCIGQVHRRADGSVDVDRMVVPVRFGQRGSESGGRTNHAGHADHSNDKNDTNARDDARATAWCLAIPFLRPGDVPRVETDGDAYLAGVAQLYREAVESALARRRPGESIIALGHCHMRDGQVSEESERRIVVGGAEALPVGIFDKAIAYVALGHLHLAQTVGQHAHIRYSGSPLPMSFSELHYPHQVLGVDVHGDNITEVRSLRVPRTVDLLRVPPTPRPVEQVIDALRALDLPACADEARPYLQVRVRLDAPEPALRARIEAELDGKPVRLARIEVTSGAGAAGEPAPLLSLDELGRLDPEAVFERLYRERHDAAIPSALLAALAELVHTADDEHAA